MPISARRRRPAADVHPARFLDLAVAQPAETVLDRQHRSRGPDRSRTPRPAPHCSCPAPVRRRTIPIRNRRRPGAVGRGAACWMVCRILWDCRNCRPQQHLRPRSHGPRTRFGRGMVCSTHSTRATTRLPRNSISCAGASGGSRAGVPRRDPPGWPGSGRTRSGRRPRRVTEDGDPGVSPSSLSRQSLDLFGGDRVAVDVVGALSRTTTLWRRPPPGRPGCRGTSSRASRAPADSEEIRTQLAAVASEAADRQVARSAAPSPR